MGAVEEGGKAVSGIVDALRVQPALLAMIILNAGLLVFMFYGLHGAATFRETLLNQQFQYQKEISALLARCVVPGARLGPTIPMSPAIERTPIPGVPPG